MKRKLVLSALGAACLCAVLCGCEASETISVPSVTASGQISALASSQDADGYVYEFCNETVYATGAVNIRAAATGSSDIVGVLEKGQSILRTSYNESWSKVEFEGKTCYVASAWLSLNPPAEETTVRETELPAEAEDETETLTAETTTSAEESTTARVTTTSAVKNRTEKTSAAEESEAPESTTE